MCFLLYLCEKQNLSLLSLSSGAWRGDPGPALQVLPELEWELEEAVFLTSYPAALLPAAGLGSLLW